MFNKIDFNNIAAFLEITLSRYGMVPHNINGTVHDFVVYHMMNKKFSNFLAGGGKAMAQDLSFKMEIMNADSKILSLKIEETDRRIRS